MIEAFMIIFGFFLFLAVFKNMIAFFWELANNLLPFFTIVFFVLLYEVCLKLV